jgi:DNA-directed RNA polymerase specialized sigma24 family protein
VGKPELRIDIARAIQSLPAHYRAIVALRDLEELTVDEIAGRLRATRETVKAPLHRARTAARVSDRRGLMFGSKAALAKAASPPCESASRLR